MFLELFHLRLEPGVEKDGLYPEASEPLEEMAVIIRLRGKLRHVVLQPAAVGGEIQPAPLQPLGRTVTAALLVRKSSPPPVNHGNPEKLLRALQWEGRETPGYLLSLGCFRKPQSLSARIAPAPWSVFCGTCS